MRPSNKAAHPLINTSRRRFVEALTMAGVAATLDRSIVPVFAQERPAPRIKLGFDNFSVRAFEWKAPQLLDYAATLKVDTVLFSDLAVYESHDDASLKGVKTKPPTSASKYTPAPAVSARRRKFNKRFGTAEEHLAWRFVSRRLLGSPVVPLLPRQRRRP